MLKSEIGNVLKDLADKVRLDTSREVEIALRGNIDAINETVGVMNAKSEEINKLMEQKIRDLENSKNSFFKYEGKKIYLFWFGMLSNIGTLLLLLYFLFLK